MEFGFVDHTGYPLGQLYLAIRFHAKARGVDLHSIEFQNNRQLFLDLGIPEKRIQTASPILIATRIDPEYKSIPIDVMNGRIPPLLDA